MRVDSRHGKGPAGCTTIVDSTGATYKAAQVGGGDDIDIDSSAFANCDVGIYISSGYGPARLDRAVVSGSFKIGIYVDTVDSMRQRLTSICINGTQRDGFTCASGANASPGTGEYVLNSPKMKVHSANIDGYTAGFATDPCPNSANKIVVDRTTITNAVYPWSFQGGTITANYDTPAPPSGGSCAGSGVGSGAGTITEYSGSGVSVPLGITAGPDGNVWFTFGNSIGKITPSGVITSYSIPTYGSAPLDIATGSDGNLWFTEGQTNKIGKVTTSGSFTEYPTPTHGSPGANPTGITRGPDGNLWFTEFAGNQIAKITTAGVPKEYPLPGVGSGAVQDITTGSDGNLWFTELGPGKIGKSTTSGLVTEYTLASGLAAEPWGIAAGSDGNLWFAEFGTNKIGKITTSGTVTEYAIPTGSSGPEGITAGPDGNLWFCESLSNKIGRVTTSGTFTEYSIPTSASTPTRITSGPDGNVWFTEYSGNKIGKIVP